MKSFKVAGSGSDKLGRYIPLIKREAGKFSVNLPPSLNYDDLVSTGMIGLLDAISKFDSTRGVKFETYAVIRIRGTILNHLNAMSWIPRSIREKEHALRRAISAFFDCEDRMPNDEETAKQMGLDRRAYEKLLEDIAPLMMISLDQYLEMEDDESIGRSERIASRSDRLAEDLLSDKERASTLRRAIIDLPEKERITVSLYYLEDLNLKEVGTVLGVSESRACQLLSKAVTRLRTDLKLKNTIL